MKDYTSAAILYFKALFMVIDYIILQKEGRIPHDHGDRFRICEKKYPNLYRILDKLFPTYRTTYTTELSKETTEEVRKKIWKSKLPEIPKKTTDKLAAEFAFSGGQIENISRKSAIDALMTGKQPGEGDLRSHCLEEKLNNHERVRVGFRKSA